MLLAAEWGTGEVFLSILWFFLFFIWIMLVVTIFMDLIRSDMSGWAKALWTIGIIILPFLGVLLYLIVNGKDMNTRSQRDAQQQQAAVDDYIRDVASTGSSGELQQLADLHSEGKLTDSEYAAAKAKVISG